MLDVPLEQLAAAANRIHDNISKVVSLFTSIARDPEKRGRATLGVEKAQRINSRAHSDVRLSFSTTTIEIPIEEPIKEKIQVASSKRPLLVPSDLGDRSMKY